VPASGHESWIPALGDLRASVQMTDAQASQIETALTQWKAATDSRRENVHSKRQPSDAGMMRASPPVAGFLAECGKVLETDQFVALTGYLKQRRSELKTHREPSRSQFQGTAIDRTVRRMVDQLALTSDQEKQVRAVLQELRASREEPRAHGRSGARPDSAQFGRLHQQLTERLSNVLTPDQQAKFDSLWTKRGKRQNADKDKWQEARINSAVECLQGILQLNESQLARIHDVFAGLSFDAPSGTGRGDGMRRFRGPLRADANLYRKAESGIRTVLSSEQIKRFDAVLQLLPGGPERS
jgi:Spy/CpxP family protein refolding chaperone